MFDGESREGDAVQTCPTCASDDPEICKLNHHHHPWSVVPRSTGYQFCCSNIFHGVRTAPDTPAPDVAQERPICGCVEGHCQRDSSSIRTPSRDLPSGCRRRCPDCDGKSEYPWVRVQDGWKVRCHFTDDEVGKWEDFATEPYSHWRCFNEFHTAPEDCAPVDEPVPMWTIHVCPDCGEPEGRVFEYEVADDAWLCEACDNYPTQARVEKVVSASELARIRTELEEARRDLGLSQQNCADLIRDRDELASQIRDERDRAQAELERLREAVGTAQGTLEGDLQFAHIRYETARAAVAILHRALEGRDEDTETRSRAVEEHAREGLREAGIDGPNADGLIELAREAGQRAGQVETAPEPPTEGERLRSDEVECGRCGGTGRERIKTDAEYEAQDAALDRANSTLTALLSELREIEAQFRRRGRLNGREGDLHAHRLRSLIEKYDPAPTQEGDK